MPRPNLLLIHTDQQALWTVGAHGGTAVATPNLDRLGREGAVLTNCHTVSAVCTPSRGCLMTGLYPHQHGAFTNNQPLDRGVATWADMLRRGGYRTGYIGKWHLDGPPRPGFVHPDRGRGFADTRYMFNRGHPKRMWDRPRLGEPGVSAEIGDEHEYPTDWLTSRALDFLDQAGSDPDAPASAGDRDPFALMLSIPDPHTPFRVREPYASMFNPADMPTPATWHDPNLPTWAQAHEAVWDADEGANLRKLRQWWAAYLGMVACIDDNVGRLLDHLDVRGLADDTAVIFTSDHGEYLGEHGLMGKNLMYRAAYHVPCLMRWPGGIGAGTVVDAMVTQNDFAATLCGWADVPPPPPAPSRDLRPLLAGQAPRWRDRVHQHHPGHDLAGLVTPQHHLILHRGGEHRLFDLADDPDERTDRFDDPDARTIRGDLASQMLAHHEDVASPAAAWLRDCRF